MSPPEGPLWAPWRVEYILREKTGHCIFCRREGEDLSAALVLYSAELSTVMLNKYPYNSGHLLVSPKRHVAGLEDLTDEEALDLFNLLTRSTAVLKKALSPEGLNIGINLGKAAGAGVEDHLHVHIVPRWHGDTNFMPVVADIRVMPEHLSATYDKLKPLFEAPAF